MNLLNNISPSLIQAYQEEMSKSSSASTMKRKSASLNKFFDWAKDKGHMEQNPLELNRVSNFSSPFVIVTPPKRINALTWIGVGITFGITALIFGFVWRLNGPIPFITNKASDNQNQITSINPTPLKTDAPSQISANNTVIMPTPLASPATPQTASYTSLTLSGSSPSINAPDGNLLIQGQGSTLKSEDGSNGSVTINPDGTGNLNVILEGSSGNQVNIQSVNLNSGSLIYGSVNNNSSGYNLLTLKSGSTPVTKFNVDSQGNVLAGSVEASGGIKINGVTRLNSLGRLSSITGYYQDSGLFAIDQGAPDTARITKTLTSAAGASTGDVLNLTLDESALTNGSNSNTLVLNRSGGTNSAMALLVNSGNVKFNGQLQLGNYSANPSAIGKGAVVFNTTDNKAYVWDGTSWVAVGGGSGSTAFSSITGGTNTSAAMIVGSGSSLNFSGTGTINVSSFNGLSATSGTTGQILASAGNGTPTWNNITSFLTAGADISITGTTNATIADASTLASVTGRGATTTNAVSVGNLTSTGTTTFGGIAYTWPATQTASYVLSTNGSGTLNWSDPSALVASSQYWAQNLGAVFPKNNSEDLLVGGNATSSAKFAFTGVNSGIPTASISGTTANTATYLTGNGNLATTDMNHLILGGSSTGQVDVNNNLNLSTGNSLLINNSSVLNSTTLGSGVVNSSLTSVGSLNSGSITNGFGSISTTNNINGLSLSTNGTQRIDSSGNITSVGTTQFNGLTYTWPGSQTNNYVLSTNGSGTLSWSDPNTLTTSSQYWSQNLGTVFPKNNSVDLFVGGNATTSAKFAFTGVNSGTPTASISGTTANVATYIDGNGNLGTTNAHDLILGSASTGNVLISSRGLTALSANGSNITTNGNVILGSNNTNNITFNGRVNSTVEPAVGSTYNMGTSASHWLNVYADTGNFNFISGTITGGSTSSQDWLINSGNVTNDTQDSTLTFERGTPATNAQFRWDSTNKYISVNTPFTISPDTSIQASGKAALIVNQTQSQDILTASASGITKATISNSGNLTLAGTIHATNIYQNNNQVCDSGGNCFGTTEFWNQAGGSLYNLNNTVDVLIGSNSTSSAKFAFKNVASGTPTATISGSVANVSTYLDGNGNLGTTNANNLTLGSSSTGNVLINSRGSTALTVNGTTLTTGGNLTVGGTTTLPNSNVLTGVTNFVQTSGGYSVGNGTTFYFNSTGDINAHNLSLTGTVGSNLTPTTTDTYNLGTSSSVEWNNVFAKAFTQNGNLVCDASGANCPVTTSYWNQSLGSLFANNNSVDVLIGSNATTSAKFAFKNVASGTPTASIAGTTANIATYITGNGNFATTNMSSLTIGGSTTGNIILNPSNSVAGGYISPNTTDVTDLGTNSLEFRNIYGNNLVTNTTGTANIFNTNATTINFAGGASSVNIGATGSNISLAGNATASGNITLGGQLQVGRFASAPTALGAGTSYFNTTDNSLYYNNGAAWVSLNPTAGGKNALQALYHALAAAYTPVGFANQYAQYESVARGISFDNFSDATKTDTANTTVSGPVQVSQANPNAIPTPSGPYRVGLIGGQTFNTTNTDSAGNAYLGSNTVNKTFYYDRNKDSSPQVQVELGIDPNWYNGVTLSVATTSAQLSQNDTITKPNSNLSTTYNGSLLKVTGNYVSNAQTIYITIKSPTTFDWTDYNGNAAAGVTMTPGTAQTLGGTGVSATFTQARYNIGDVFRISSWYVEPSSSTRGAKAQFPERNYINATATSVDIIDADTQKLWMRFSTGTNFALATSTNDSPSSINILNGELYVSKNGSAATGLYTFDFAHDMAFRRNATDYRASNVPLTGRNGTNNYNVINISNILVNTITNDVAAAVIPNQPTGQVTVSGWGYMQGTGTTGPIAENVNFPYKFNDIPRVAISANGYSTTTPTKLSDCNNLTTANNTAQAITNNGFAAYTYAYGGNFGTNYYCYTWTATGIVSPKQFVAVATGNSSTNGGTTIVNETDGTSANVSIGSQVGANYVWQDKVALANNTLYTAGGQNTSTTYIGVYYGINAITTSETSYGQYRNGYYYVGQQSSGWSAAGPVILGTAGTRFNSLFVTPGTSTTDGTSNTIYVGNASGLSVIQEKQGGANIGDGSVESGGSVKYYTNTYNSEEMVGDIRGMWPLSSNGALSLSDASIKADTLTNNGTVTAVTGVRGMAASFNGTTQYLSCTDVTCGGTSKLDPGASALAWNLGAWVKTTGSTQSDIVAKGQSADYSYILEMGTNGKVTYYLLQASGNIYSSVTSNVAINDGQWHFVVGTRDNGTTKIYVDGIYQGSDSTNAGTFDSDSAAPFAIGRLGGDNARYWNGQIDEPFVTATTLSASQIKHMYDVGYRSLQSHGTNLGGSSADKNQQLAGSQTPNSVVLDAKADTNNQFLYVSSSEGGLNLGGGGVSKIDLNSDTNIYTYTSSSTPKLLDSEVTSLAVGYNLEAMSSTQSGTLAPGYDSRATGTTGSFFSKSVTLPEAVTSVYLWTNTYTDSLDSGSTLTVQASNDGGSTYVTCSNTNNDTNQTPQENEYVCRFASAGTNLKIKFTFARTATKENNYITQYGVGWTSTGADFAENYMTDEQDLDIANLVRIKSGGINTLVGKTITKYDNTMIGVVSTRPGDTLGPTDGTTPGYSSNTQSGTHSVPIALAGRVPVKVDSENGSIHKGDYITASSTPGFGMRATKSGKVIGQALEDWDESTDRVLVFLNPGYFAGVVTADGGLNTNQNSIAAKDDNQISLIKQIFGIYDNTFGKQSTNSAQNTEATGSGVITSLNDFINGLTQNVNIDTLQATIVNAKGIIATIIKGSQAFFDEIASTTIKTNLISPITDSTNIFVQIGSSATPSGQFVIQNASGSAVAKIDSTGNATFSGTVSSRSLNVDDSASVSGTLYADSIKSKSIDDIKNILTQIESDQNLINNTANWNTNTASSSANLAKINGDVSITNLYVTGHGVFDSLSVAKTVNIGADLVLSSSLNGQNIYNSIDTLSAPLRLQSLALSPVEIMNGLVKIDTTGNVQIAGNLAVGGDLNVKGKIAGSSVNVTNMSGDTVSSINASGSADFNSIAAKELIISAPNATAAAQIINGVITTDSPLGSATLPANTSQVTINNSRVTDYSFVYVTPTSDTKNNVLFIKSKQNGQFTVGFTNPVDIDVSFNWWIVQVKN